MEKYREKLKVDTVVIAVIALILAAVSVLAVVNEFSSVKVFTPVTGDSHWHSKWNGFVSGAAAGLLVFMVMALIRNIRAIRNEQALKKLYVKDNDERTAEIIKSAQAAAYRTLILVGLVAVVVAGYFSITVSLTLLVCVFSSALLGALYKFYFRKKF